MPDSNLKLRQSQTHNFTGTHESRNLQKELVLSTKKTNPVVERSFNEAFKVNNRGLYDIKNMFKSKNDERVEAANNVKDIMFQMLYDEQKYGLAQKQKELFGTTQTVANKDNEHSRPDLIQRVSEGIQKACLLQGAIKFELNEKMLDLLAGKEIDIETNKRTLKTVRNKTKSVDIPYESQLVIDNVLKKNPIIRDFEVKETFEISKKRGSLKERGVTDLKQMAGEIG